LGTDDYQSVYGRCERSAECVRGESSCNRCRARDQLLPIRIDVQAAAAVAYSIALRDAAPERRAEFEKLSNAALFDVASLDTLKQLALATWHARQQQQLSTGTASGATVPAPVLVEAQDVRGRMLRVLEYYFEAHLLVGPQLSVVRAGGGYQALDFGIGFDGHGTRRVASQPSAANCGSADSADCERETSRLVAGRRATRSRCSRKVPSRRRRASPAAKSTAVSNLPPEPAAPLKRALTGLFSAPL
jgi:hypothetical protein